MTEEKKDIKEGYKFQFLIQKAQAGADMIVEGIASTTNVDHDLERMTPEAIAKMKEYILKNDIPLIDEHGKGWHDKLGKIISADVDARGQLKIKAKLDAANSKAVDLYKGLKNGAQLGLSVAGRVKKFGLDMVESLGQKVKSFYDIILDEISVTRSPSNYDTSLIAKGGWQGIIAKSIPDNEWNILKNNNNTMEKETKEVKKASDTSTTETETTTAEEKKKAVKKEAPKKEEAKKEDTTTSETTDTIETPKSTKKNALTPEMKLQKVGELVKALGDALGTETETTTEETKCNKSVDKKAEEDTDNEVFEKKMHDKVREYTQQIIKSFEAKNMEIVGGVKRIEEYVESIANMPLVRKGKAFATKEKAYLIEKKFTGNPDEEEKEKGKKDENFKDYYKREASIFKPKEKE